MAKSKTPAKRARNAEKARVRNKSYKSALKTGIKRFELSLTGDDVDASRDILLKATSLIDKSVSKGILHKNNAARKKSRLTKKLNSIVK
ncbi:MAG: 30S ribosomal protein S20 [Syntrophomonas sp.]|nr:30S ribosomal protein S20 [Syntrophomonas sp.]